jgi:hypothetical protein
VLLDPIDQTLAQEREFRAAIYGALDQLELMNLPFCLSIAIDFAEPCHDSVFVLKYPIDKPAQFGDLAVLDSFDPGIELLSLTFAYHGEKLLNQPVCGLNGCACRTNVKKFFLLFSGELAFLTNEQPDRIASTELLNW